MSETSSQLRNIIFCALYCVVLVFNVTGNSLVIHIISRKQRSATDYLLLNLAVADLIFGIFLAPFFLYPMFVSSTVLHAADFTCRFPVNIGNISWIVCIASLFTVTILTIERYFAVCRPHSFKRYFSIKNVKRLLVVGWLLSIALQTIRIITDKCQNDKNYTKTHTSINAGSSGFYLLFLMVLSIKIYLSLWCKHTVIQPTAQREIEETKKKKKVTLCVLRSS